MRMTRRAMLGACAGTLPAPGTALSGASGGHGPLGLVIDSFAVRTAGDRGRKTQDRFRSRPDSSATPARSARWRIKSVSGPSPTLRPMLSRERALCRLDVSGRDRRRSLATRPTWNDLRPRSARRSEPGCRLCGR